MNNVANFLKFAKKLSSENCEYKILKIELSDNTDECFKLYMEYKKVVFQIKLIKENNFLFWILTPYNGSYFKTKAVNNKSFELVMIAIKKHLDLVNF